MWRPSILHVSLIWFDSIRWALPLHLPSIWFVGFHQLCWLHSIEYAGKIIQRNPEYPYRRKKVFLGCCFLPFAFLDVAVPSRNANAMKNGHINWIHLCATFAKCVRIWVYVCYAMWFTTTHRRLFQVCRLQNVINIRSFMIANASQFTFDI